ncbi:ABC transporter ATP-binding protein [Qingshengfaniella alkalisoli]|uniref:ABC transporter ATP-binding protein n=1 Tax=Qingshengfaniella alkalisoli TaxID=2599296 RepID=A0A5B8IWZ0_9RHOB|nr:ABC transporter ATP-binding protein [Qingshengfaniella alkalisoli]QDY69078.1 ABC transporter ATP-binding protein [Qingshengfaniella alkalisoli]
MLEIKNLTLRYGHHLALEDVSLTVAQGETVVLLGANGAGKSSLLKSVGRLVQPAGGDILLGDASLLPLPAHEIVNRGIAIVPENRGIFRAMTVEENLRLGANPARARTNEALMRGEIFALFPRLAERRQQLVRTMSGGEQQMVAIARALMSRPDYLLLDEPSLGLAPIVTQELFAALDRIRQTGLAMLIVEQNVKATLTLANRGYVLEAGRIIGSGTSEQLATDPLVQKAFLGSAETV